MISAICVSCRDEEAKAIRRVLGDYGGIKFRHGTYAFRGGGATRSIPSKRTIF